MEESLSTERRLEKSIFLDRGFYLSPERRLDESFSLERVNWRNLSLQREKLLMRQSADKLVRIFH